jgi:hypothetical protein
MVAFWKDGGHHAELYKWKIAISTVPPTPTGGQLIRCGLMDPDGV